MYAKLERKSCSLCKETKSLDGFRLRQNKQGRKPHFESQCKDCERSTRKAQYQKNKGYWKRYDYERNCMKFGLTAEKYEEMIRQQGNKCAICKNPEIAMRAGKLKQLAIDHCHSTGTVRALLCTRCNTAMGLLKEDPALFDAAKKYLEKFKSQR